MARPRKPEGAKVQIGTRVPDPVRDALDRIADREGITRSALLERILTRYAETYPLGDT